MKKLFLLSILVLGISTQFQVTAQTKQKAEETFLNLLNKIVKNSDDPCGYLKNNPGIIETPFNIDSKGILSITFKDTTEQRRMRIAAPVKKIKGLAFDEGFSSISFFFNRMSTIITYQYKDGEPFKKGMETIYFPIDRFKKDKALEEYPYTKEIEVVLKDLLKYY
jgi:hypothetical protein